MGKTNYHTVGIQKGLTQIPGTPYLITPAFPIAKFSYFHKSRRDMSPGGTIDNSLGLRAPGKIMRASNQPRRGEREFSIALYRA